MPDGNDSATGKSGSGLRELSLVLPKVRTTHLNLRQHPSAPLAHFLPIPQVLAAVRILTSETTFVTLRAWKRTLSALDFGPTPGGPKAISYWLALITVIPAFSEYRIS
jgi:hypothetical protein